MEGEKQFQMWMDVFMKTPTNASWPVIFAFISGLMPQFADYDLLTFIHNTSFPLEAVCSE